VATNLQVNASTQQAVGAFNALAASISNANQQFQNLNRTMANGRGVAGSYGNQITGLKSAFDLLSGTLSSFFSIVTKLGAGLEFLFSSIVKELDKIQGFNALMLVSTKSSKDAAESYSFLRRTADNLGVQFDSLLNNYSKLLAAIPEGNNRLEITRKAFLGIAMAARTLHASNTDTQLMFYAITQMASKGVVSMEELRRQLGEKLPGVMQIAAKAFNTVPEELEKAIRKGTVNSEKFLAGFSDQLIRTFADSSAKASESVSASVNRLTNVWTDFVKEVLDSGSGGAIIKFFDALREKLSDPYLIKRFGELVKYIADKLTEFVSKLTEDDLRNGFDTFVKGIEMVAKILGKVIDAINWIINNSGKAGAAIGGVAGAVSGFAVAGPWGAAAGGIAGAAGGAYAGSQLGSTPEQQAARDSMNAAALQAKQEKKIDQELVLYKMMLPMLQNFKGLDNLKDVQPLLQGEKLTRESVQALVKILSDPRFKNDKERAQGAIDYAKTGEILAPNTGKLSDIMGAGKKTKGDGGFMAAQLHSAGLNSTFLKEWDNLNKAYKQGKTSVEQLEAAQAKLLAQQPFMVQAAQEQKKELGEYNKQLEESINMALKQVAVKEDVRQDLEDQTRLAGMSAENRQTEAQVQQILNRYRDVGIVATQTEIALLREKLQIIRDTSQLSQAQDALLAQTVDKYKAQILELQAIKKSVADPSTGLTQERAADYMVQKTPGAEGSTQWMEAQQRSLTEYYTWLETLRREDLLSEETVLALKAKAQNQYESVRLSQASEFFGGLASLAKSGNSKLAAVGKAAAIAQATIQGYVAVQNALATPPYYVGIALAVGAATTAAANIAAIVNQKGYEVGGYTGNGSRNAVAGIVHGEEFVSNALATSRNRPMLEFMNAGGVPQAEGGSRGNITVEYHNYGTGKSAEVQQIDETRIRVITRDEIQKTTPGLIAGEIARPNSDVSKSLKNHTQGGARQR
jgi:tape measure domain-containing protein